jgi:hypothetical protein
MIRRVTIDTYQVGLVFENRKLMDVIKEGTKWVFGDKQVMVYEKTVSFQSPYEFNVLLQNDVLASMLYQLYLLSSPN